MSDIAPRIPLLGALYEEYRNHRDSEAFAGRVAQHYTPGTLERLAQHPLREIRRGAVLALGLLADYDANHTMGRALSDADRQVRTLAENGIRALWFREGSSAQQQQLALVGRLITAGKFAAAVRHATRLIEVAPYYSEAWNQRALAHFSLRHYAEAIRDCHQALELNPYHFGAAAGMGQAYLELGNRASALEAFRRALQLNPGMEAVRVQVVRLARLVEGR